MHSFAKFTAYNIMGPFITDLACVDMCTRKADLIHNLVTTTSMSVISSERLAYRYMGL